jgi:hypothetical protein
LVTRMKSHGCQFCEDGDRRPASRIWSRSAAGIGQPAKDRTLRRDSMASQIWMMVPTSTTPNSFSAARLIHHSLCSPLPEDPPVPEAARTTSSATDRPSAMRMSYRALPKAMTSRIAIRSGSSAGSQGLTGAGPGCKRRGSGRGTRAANRQARGSPVDVVCLADAHDECFLARLGVTGE